MSSGDFTITAPHNKKKYLDNVVGPFTAYQQQINIVLIITRTKSMHTQVQLWPRRRRYT